MQKQRPVDRAARARRRQKLFNRAIFAITIAIIIIVSVYALSRPSGVELPSYLNRCIPNDASKLVYSSSFQLFIVENGVNQTIPNNIGRFGTCLHPIYTATFTGTIHISSDVNRTYTLHDFFLLYGSTYGPTYAVFDQNHLFGLTTDSTHHITMTVGNQTDYRFDQYPLPTSGKSDTNPPVTITYGS